MKFLLRVDLAAQGADSYDAFGINYKLHVSWALIDYAFCDTKSQQPHTDIHVNAYEFQAAVAAGKIIWLKLYH